MRKARHYWTDKESQLLVDHYASGKSFDWIAVKLGFSPGQVYGKAKYLCITKRKFVPANKSIFTDQQIQLIKDRFHSMTNVQLAKVLDKKLTVVRDKCRELGLLHIQLEYWTVAQVEYLRANYQMKGDVELAEYFNTVKEWKKNKGWTKKHIEKKRRYLKLDRTKPQLVVIKQRNVVQGRFSINHWKRWKDLEAPIGDIRTWVSQLGNLYKVIKTKDGFVHLAPHIFKIHHGKVKPGYIVTFKDGNPLNCSPENLIQISRAENAMRVVAVHARGKSYQYLAGIMARGDQELKKVLLQNTELLEVKKMQLKLNRLIEDERHDTTRKNA